MRSKMAKSCDRGLSKLFDAKTGHKRAKHSF